MRSRQKALLTAELAEAKRAEDIVILDMRRLSSITDFFVITSASSARRSQTIAGHIEEELQKKGEAVSDIEGYREGSWILIDAYDVVAHVFLTEIRKFYDLEGLWADAPRIKLCHKKKKTTSRKTSKRK